MSKGHAICIGLNKVSPNHYDGWDGELAVCEYDAICMEKLLKLRKFTTEKLLSTKATRENVLNSLKTSAENLKPGDTLVVYYSGHGGNEIPDTNKDEDDPWDDRFDETWCLFDGQLIDDELFKCWRKFSKDIAIIVISDSCFSGDILKLHNTTKIATKAMPRDTGLATYKKNKEFYDELLQALDSNKLKQFKGTKQAKIKATVLQLSSSQEGQTSCAETEWYPKNSLFTGVLLEQLGKRPRSYEELFSKIIRKMPDYQAPADQIIGNNNMKITLKKPFTF